MTNIIKYVMRIFYANENYGKYGVAGFNYFMAIIGAAFYIMITGFAIIILFFAAFPEAYKKYLAIGSKIPTIPSGILILGVIFLLLRITINEDSLKDSSFTKEYVTKAMNYLIIYGLGVGFVFVFLSLKFLRHH